MIPKATAYTAHYPPPQHFSPALYSRLQDFVKVELRSALAREVRTQSDIQPSAMTAAVEHPLASGSGQALGQSHPPVLPVSPAISPSLLSELRQIFSSLDIKGVGHINEAQFARLRTVLRLDEGKLRAKFRQAKKMKDGRSGTTLPLQEEQAQRFLCSARTRSGSEASSHPRTRRMKSNQVFLHFPCWTAVLH